MTFIKFCGMTRKTTCGAACDLGVSAVGFVMWPGSPRYVAPERTAALVAATSAAVLPVGVLVSPSVTDLSAATRRRHSHVPDSRGTRRHLQTSHWLFGGPRHSKPR